MNRRKQKKKIEAFHVNRPNELPCLQHLGECQKVHRLQTIAEAKGNSVYFGSEDHFLETRLQNSSV